MDPLRENNPLRRPRFDPANADDDGLVAVGYDLRPETILEAYVSGVFPTRFFPFNDEKLPMFWWSPDPRAVLELDGLYVTRRLARTIRSGRFSASINREFSAVISGCGEREEGTWITGDMATAYTRLHQLGVAHSLEVWRGDRLAGGLYGLAIRGLFAAESMFYRERDASKVALVYLVHHLRHRGFSLLDIQMLTPHTASLGAVEIPRAVYLDRLRYALTLSPQFA